MMVVYEEESWWKTAVLMAPSPRELHWNTKSRDETR
jgi:hypothetical protein